ncbi:MAG: tetratricopeptide repeat protein [Deltaproteobacteria bacterium]|nr:tetratricopeptide repeat protein [Deltaproteobacteria bacterium]
MIKEIKTLAASLLRSPSDSDLLEEFSSSFRETESSGNEKTDFILKYYQKAVAVRLYMLGYDLLRIGIENDPENVQLLRTMAELLDSQLWMGNAALETYQKLASLEPSDEESVDRAQSLELESENWEKLLEKYLSEADGSTEPELIGHMYYRAAEVAAKYSEDPSMVEELLIKAHDADPENPDITVHLEHYYRISGKYEDLISLLEGKLNSIEEPQEKLTYLLELSKLYIEKTDTPEKSEGFLLTALEVVPGDEAAKSLLVEAFTVQEKWEDLIAFYEFEIKNSRSQDIGNYIQLGMLWWKKVGDLDSAEQYFQRVMMAEPDSPLVLNFYGEFYTSKGDVLRHIAMLQKAMRTVKNDENRTFELARKISEVARESNPEKAIEVWKKIYKSNPDSTEAIEALKELYESTEKWNLLLELYKDEEHRLSKDDDAGKITVLFKMAELIEDKMKVDAMVVSVYNQILKLDPENSRALDNLVEKYEAMNRWKEVVSIYQQKLDSEENDHAKIKFLKKIATLWNDRLSNPNKAAEPLENVLAIDPTDREVIEQLKDIYEKRRNWKGLFDLKMMELNMVSDSEKMPLLVEVAKFAQQPLGNLKLAIESWNLVLEEDPHDIDAMENLIFLYEREKRYGALVEMLRRKISLSTDDEALPLLEKAGALITDKIGNLGSLAMEIWQTVNDFNPNHPKAIKILKELYAANKNWEKLEHLFSQKENWTGYIETLSGCADSTDDTEEKISLLFKVSSIYINQLEKPDRAVKPFEKILETDPANREAAQQLLPIYENAGKWPLAASMYEILAENVDDIDEKLQWMDKLIGLYTQNLSSPEKAFDISCRAFRIKPNDKALASQIETFAGEAGLWREASDVFAESSEELSGENQIDILSRLARIQVEELTEFETGETTWKKVLDLDPKSPVALSGLGTIYEFREDWNALIDILKLQLEILSDSGYLTSARHKMAEIYETQLDRKNDAIVLYKEILSDDEMNLKALSALDRLYLETEKWDELSAILDTRLTLTNDDSPDQTDLRYRVGTLKFEHLNEKDEAMEQFALIMENTSPAHGETVQGLMKILLGDGEKSFRLKSARLLAPHFSENNNWEDYSQALEVIAEFEDELQEKLDHYRELLSVVTRKVGDTGKGFEIACTLFKLDPLSEDTRQELRSLSRLDDRLEDLKDLYLEFIVSEIENLRLELAWEIALLEEEDRDDRTEAEKYYLIVLEENPLHEGAFLALERLYSSSDRWEELRKLYSSTIDAQDDIELKKELVLKLSHLNENMLTDIPAAIKSYSTLRELEGGSPEAFESLVRLYELSDDWESLARIYEEDFAYQETPEQQIRYLYSRADILLHKLNRNMEAVEIVRDILNIRKDHENTRKLLLEMLDIPETRQESSVILSELYEQDSDYESLVHMYEIQLEFATEDHDAVEILARQADVLTIQLGDPEKAFSALRRALKREPDNEEVRASIEQLAIAINSYGELVEVWKDAISSSKDEEGLILFYTERIARIYERQLSDIENAILWYRKLLDAEGDTEYQAKAALALIDLYSMQSEWIEIIDLNNRQLSWVTEENERKNIYRRIAALQEDMLDAPEDAARAYNRLLEEFPDDKDALERLEFIYSRIGKWAELVDVLSKKVDFTTDSEIRHSCYSRIAILREESLNETEGAAEAWNSILLENPEDGEALRNLARLYESLERWADVYDLVERELNLTTDPDMARSLKYRLGYILQIHLEESERAIEKYRDVLEEDPGHDKAKLALESMLQGDEYLALSAAGILETIYDLEDNFEKLTGLYVLKAGYSMDPREKIDLFLKIARIKENQLGEVVAAFGFYGQACKEALSDPDLPEILSQLQRLASIEGRWTDLVELYRSIGDDIMDMKIQENVYLTIADVARDALNDLKVSRQYYEKVLEQSPENLHAMDALERVYEDTSDWQALHDIYIRRSELVGIAEDTKFEVLVKAAELSHKKLEDPEQAVEHFNDILLFRPDDSGIFRSLEGLYFDLEKWEELISLYEQRIRFVEDIEEAVEIRFNMGEIFMDFLEDSDRAIESFKASLGGNPSSEETITRLEKFLDEEYYALQAAEVLVPIYAARQVWTKLINVFSLQRNLESDPEIKSSLTKRIADLYESVLEDLEQAFVWYGYLLQEKPENSSVLDRLLNLAELLEKWEEISVVLAKVLEESYGDSEHILKISEELARIYARKLSRVDSSIECYKRILNADRSRDDIFTELELLLLENEKWDVLLEVYREVADSYFDPTKKNPYLYKICGVLEDRLEKNDEAIEVFREIIEGDPQDQRAVDSLTRLFTKLEKWEDLVEHLTYQVDTRTDADDIISINLRLSELYFEKLGDPQSSVDCLENILRADPLNERALTYLEKLIANEDVKLRVAIILLPIYQQLDQWQQLVKVYEVQIELSDDDFQRISYLKECSLIYDERANDLNKSFKALAKAWQLETSDAQTLENIYGLALRSGNWAELIEVLQSGIKDSYDTELQVNVLMRIARIQNETLEETENAIASYRSVLEIRDDHPEALTELSILLSESENWEELAEVLDKKSEILSDPESAGETLRKLANLRMDILEENQKAIETWRKLLDFIPMDEEALRALEKLYEQSEMWDELPDIISNLMDVSPDERIEKAFKLSGIYEEKLEDLYEATNALKLIIEEVPDSKKALNDLSRLYRKEENWADLIDCLDRMISLETEDTERNKLIFTTAQVLHDELSDVTGALEKYRFILDFSPNYQPALDALEKILEEDEYTSNVASILEPLYVSQDNDEALIKLYSTLIDRDLEQTELSGYLENLAKLYEKSGNPKEAFKFWGKLFKLQPGDQNSELQLQRIATETEQWNDLTEIYENITEDVYDEELKTRLMLTDSRIHELNMEDLEGAVSVLEKLVESIPPDLKILRELDRLLVSTQKWEKLSELLDMEANSAFEPDEKAVFNYRLGDLKLNQLSDHHGAIDSFRAALDSSPGHPDSIAALEKMMSGEKEYLVEVLDVLEPVWESLGQQQNLIKVYEARTSLSEDSMDKSALMEKAARLSSTLGNFESTISYWGKAFSYSPEELLYLEEFISSAEMAGSTEIVYNAVKLALDNDIDDMTAVTAAQKTAELMLRNGNSEYAQEMYQQILKREPENNTALKSLEEMYRVSDNTEELVKILEKRSEIEFDPSVKKPLLVEIADIYENGMNNLPKALQAWKELLENDESDGETQLQLIRIYEKMEYYNDLVDILNIRINYLQTVEERQAVRKKIARIYDEKLDKPDEAEEAWRDAFEASPSDEEAFKEMLKIFKGREDWDAVKDMYFTRLSMAETDAGKIEALTALANLSLNNLNEPEDAADYYQQIMDIDPSMEKIFDKLSSILKSSERFYDMIELFKKRASHFNSVGDSVQEIIHLDKIARIWEENLENPDEALKILEQILEQQPSNVTALTGLARLYENRSDWESCQQYLEKAALLEPTGVEGAELACRRGNVASKLGDEETAVMRWEEALGYHPRHVEAFTHLKEYSDLKNDSHMKLKLFQTRLPFITDVEDRLEALLEMSDIFVASGAPEAAFPYLEEASSLDSGNIEVKKKLGDVYFSSGNFEKSEEIYNALSEELSKDRSAKKELATIYQRLGGIRESQSDFANAVDFYTKSQRLDPTYIPNLIAMANCNLKMGNNDQAQKLYRALLFQKIDGFITKAEIFLEIAKIDLSMGNTPKAKASAQRGLSEDPTNEAIKAFLNEIQ